MNKLTTLAAAMGVLAITSTTALAATEIQWWHAMGGVNNERVDKIAADFNASQSEYKVVPTNKGNYTETMTAAVAAFRAKKQPHIVRASCYQCRLIAQRQCFGTTRTRLRKPV